MREAIEKPTSREREVMALGAEGFANKENGKALEPSRPGDPCRRHES